MESAGSSVRTEINMYEDNEAYDPEVDLFENDTQHNINYTQSTESNFEPEVDLLEFDLSELNLNQLNYLNRDFKYLAKEITCEQLTEQIDELNESYRQHQLEIHLKKMEIASQQEKKTTLLLAVDKARESLAVKRRMIHTLRCSQEQKEKADLNLKKKMADTSAYYDQHYKETKAMYENLPLAKKLRYKEKKIDVIKIDLAIIRQRIKEQKFKNKQLLEIQTLHKQQNIVKFSEFMLKYHKAVKLKKKLEECKENINKLNEKKEEITQKIAVAKEKEEQENMVTNNEAPTCLNLDLPCTALDIQTFVNISNISNILEKKPVSQPNPVKHNLKNVLQKPVSQPNSIENLLINKNLMTNEIFSNIISFKNAFRQTKKYISTYFVTHPEICNQTILENPVTIRNEVQSSAPSDFSANIDEDHPLILSGTSTKVDEVNSLILSGTSTEDNEVHSHVIPIKSSTIVEVHVPIALSNFAEKGNEVQSPVVLASTTQTSFTETEKNRNQPLLVSGTKIINNDLNSKSQMNSHTLVNDQEEIVLCNDVSSPNKRKLTNIAICDTSSKQTPEDPDLGCIKKKYAKLDIIPEETGEIVNIRESHTGYTQAVQQMKLNDTSRVIHEKTIEISNEILNMKMMPPGAEIAKKAVSFVVPDTTSPYFEESIPARKKEAINSATNITNVCHFQKNIPCAQEDTSSMSYVQKETANNREEHNTNQDNTFKNTVGNNDMTFNDSISVYSPLPHTSSTAVDYYKDLDTTGSDISMRNFMLSQEGTTIPNVSNFILSPDSIHPSDQTVLSPFESNVINNQTNSPSLFDMFNSKAKSIDNEGFKFSFSTTTNSSKTATFFNMF